MSERCFSVSEFQWNEEIDGPPSLGSYGEVNWRMEKSGDRCQVSGVREERTARIKNQGVSGTV